MTNLREIIDNTCDRYSDRKFLFWEDPDTKDTTVITFSDYKKSTNKIAHMLFNLGVRKGEIVSTLIPNCLELTYFALGVQKIGAISCNPDNEILVVLWIFLGIHESLFIHHIKLNVTDPQVSPGP